MVCDAFKHSPVYRIGGDEFVAILLDQDYARRLEITDQLKADYESAFAKTDDSPWLRYSAAVGMAEYSPDDYSAEIVFRRADKAMYENKTQFKNSHGGMTR